MAASAPGSTLPCGFGASIAALAAGCASCLRRVLSTAGTGAAFASAGGTAAIDAMLARAMVTLPSTGCSTTIDSAVSDTSLARMASPDESATITDWPGVGAGGAGSCARAGAVRARMEAMARCFMSGVPG